LLRGETVDRAAEEPAASEPAPLVAELPSVPRAKAPPASLAGTFAGLAPIAWVRKKPRLWAAGAAGLVVIVLATYLLVRKGSLNVEVRPNGKWALGEISVLVDGEKRCSRSPCRVDGLSAGGHEVAVTATGYRRESVPVAVSRGAVNAVPVTLELDGPTGIAVADLGSEVQLFVDGQSRGNVPQEITRMAPGEHQIVIEGGERYQSFKTRVTVEPGKMVSLAPKLKVKKGRVTIQLGQDANEAKIELVCGADRRPAPKQAFDVAAEQSCKVVAAKDGFQPFDQAIQFNDGEAERLIKVDLVEDPHAQQGSAPVRADDRSARLPERQSTIERPRLNPDAK
jgi:serine/threonine-protein kinase